MNRTSGPLRRVPRELSLLSLSLHKADVYRAGHLSRLHAAPQDGPESPALSPCASGAESASCCSNSAEGTQPRPEHQDVASSSPCAILKRFVQVWALRKECHSRVI